MSNKNNTVIYTGVTANLMERVGRHKNLADNSFTRRYKITKLVYYEEYATMNDAISREKQIKGGSRKKKIDLINKTNPAWKDLADEL